MKHRALVAVLTVLALGLSLSRADAADPATLTVTGAGAVAHAPDSAVVDLSVTTNDELSAAKATDENNVAFNGLRDRLRSLGVNDAEVKTTSLSVRFVARPAAMRAPLSVEPAQQRFGYVATRALSVTAPRIDAAGRVVDAAVAAGAQVEGVRFTLADQRAAYAQALAAAVADASAQADAVAQAARLHVAGIKSIDVTSGSAPPVFAARAAALAATPTEITPVPLEIRASVTVTYFVAP